MRKPKLKRLEKHFGTRKTRVAAAAAAAARADARGVTYRTGNRRAAAHRSGNGSSDDMS